MAKARSIRRGPMVRGEDFARTIALTSNGLLHQRPEAAISQQYKDAVVAFDAALADTIKYLDRLARGEKPDPKIEDNLSECWRQTSFAVRPFDRDLADRCFMKGQGWLDPRLWNDPEFKNLGLSIKHMRNALRELNRMDLPTELPKWFPLAGVTFAAATFLSLLYLMINSDLTPGNRIIFDAWLAFCVASSSAFFGGGAIAKGNLSLPFFKNSPIKFSAFGGIAIFIVVFLILFGAHHNQ